MNILKQISQPIASVRFHVGTRRAAKATAHAVKKAGIKPALLIDAGCNKSQWARYFLSEFPPNTIEVHSIDVQDLKPLGVFHHVALGAEGGRVGIKSAGINGGSSYVVKAGGGDYDIPMKRLDDLGIKSTGPAVIKIDCEASSYPALVGAAGSLHNCCAVCIEMANTVESLDCNLNSQLDTARFMSTAGFSKMDCVNCFMENNQIIVWDALFTR